MLKTIITVSSLVLAVKSLQFQPVYTLPNLPVKAEPGQSGTNLCPTDSQTSLCQNAYINSVEDFCLWGPPEPGLTIGDTERIQVSWCTRAGRGTRLIPKGAITGAHWVETPQYIQITGQGDLTALNIQAGDAGGELDPHGIDGNGNPIGGLVFSTAYGPNQVAEWTSFISSTEFCFRICKAGGSDYLWCQHIYDLQGCWWNEPGNYSTGFDTCSGDTTVTPPGIYISNGTTSTYQQGDGSTPAPIAHLAGATSNCVSNTPPGVTGISRTGSLPIPTGNSTSSTAPLSTLSSSSSTTSSSSTRSTTTSNTSSSFRTSTTTSSGGASAGSAVISPSATSTNAANRGYTSGATVFVAALVAFLG